MDLVLGLSVTSKAARSVLVQGTSGEGLTIDRNAVEIGAADAPQAVVPALGHYALAAAHEGRLGAVGVTWTRDAGPAASALFDELSAAGVENVIAVSDVEAAEALATGIADISEHADVAVFVVEPDAAVLASVTAQGTVVDRIDRRAGGGDAAELVAALTAMVDGSRWLPESVFVLGSADDLDAVVAALEQVTAAPVISAAEADLALARGAALASASAMRSLVAAGAPAGPRLPSATAALSSVLVAAVLTFVVSVSVAVGQGLTPDSEAQQTASAEEPASSPETASIAQAARRSLLPAAPAAAPSIVEAPPPPPPAAPPVVEAPAPAPEVAPEPVYDPPAAPAVEPPAAPAPEPAYVPPAPAYVPPAPAPEYVPPAPPPAYVAPAPGYVPPQPQPRLRDRIIERIPIINRFHEPKYPYP